MGKGVRRVVGNDRIGQTFVVASVEMRFASVEVPWFARSSSLRFLSSSSLSLMLS